MRDIYILIFALVLGSVGHLATDIYLPSLPNLTEYFTTSNAYVQLTLTAYMLSYCLTPLIMGPISDHIGRKKPILFGLVISLIATLGCIYANSIYALIMARFLQGIGLGMVATVSRTILPDNFTGQRLAKYFSYMTMFMPLVLAIGPPLGGIIQDNSSWQTVFGFLMIHMVILLFIVKIYFQDKSRPQEAKMNSKQNGVISNQENKQTSMDKHIKHINMLKKIQIFNSYKLLFKNTRFIRYSACSVILFMGITAYLAVNPFLFQNVFGLTPTQNGCVALILFASTFISGFINSRLITVYPGKKMLYMANILIFSSGFLLYFVSQLNDMTFLNFIFFVLPFFLSVPIVFSITGSIALSSVQGNFGAATALLSTFQYLGGALSSFLISFADQETVVPLGITFIILGILFFLTLFFEQGIDGAVKPVENI